MDATPIRRAEVGCGVTIASQPICSSGGGAEFGRRIHIYTPGEECKCTKPRGGDLYLQLHNKKKFGFDVISQIHKFTQKQGTLLIHCGAGMHRSPTAAVIALHARGLSLGEAMGRIVDATCRYDDQPIMPYWDFEMMEEIRLALQTEKVTA